jgi:Na+/H+ antiporter NhaD/arsenite permease-like protein
MHKVGLANHDWSVFAANFVAHALVAVAAYLLFGGIKLLRTPRVALAESDGAAPLTGRQWFTLVVLAGWIAGVVAFKVSPGLSAFAGAALLILGRTAEDHQAVAAVPWSVLLMVTGVSVLVGVLEKTGGMDLFIAMLARLATPDTVNGAMAFVTGLISTYSSTSGVVYPAFLPMVPGLVEKLGGGNPLEVALSINVGAALVDVSPLSTIGALCIAGLPAGGDARKLFRQMLLWGFSMIVIGAVFCQCCIPFFAR